MANKSGDFKWFGEGFDGFPKTISDDCVHYAIYTIVAKANDFTGREQLRKVQVAANALCKTVLKGFIWQRDGFGLEIVWINNGKLFIVPKARSNEKARVEGLRLDDALTFIQDNASGLLHSPSIEAEAFYRLRKKLAYILHHDAAYISPAVEAFYLRDPIALRPLQSRDSSKLYFPSEDLVAVSVKFTKVGYAQLKGQTFQMPPAWAACTARGHVTPDKADSEMGMKVTCGFEMLLSDPHNVDKKPVREIRLLLEDLEVGEAQLPSNDEISGWDFRRDDESWLDINFEDFDRELSGRGHQLPGQTAGFGDKMVQDHLRKIVGRFENLLHEEDGSAEDAEFLDDMDNDDESEDSGTADGTASDDRTSEKGVDFDEDHFASMMREMMGLPPSTVVQNAADIGLRPDSQVVVGEEDAGMDEEKGIRQVMEDMETELRQAGALDTSAYKKGSGDDEEISINFDQANDLLESQAWLEF
ncbi:MAG: hypothetical protein Q9184_001907 [Pyrenodesmia sp. 2 TL-2023]